MTQPSSAHAIKLALAQRWSEAIKVNKELLKENAEDLDTLKRIAYAYIQIGNVKKAKTYYDTILKIDKNNPIALKGLERLKNLNAPVAGNSMTTASTPRIFLEEPGRTKVVTLINLAPNKVLCNIAVGQRVLLKPKRHSVEIRDDHKVYLGALPDDIAHRLARLVAGGNEYETYIKHVSKNKLTVFIRETKRSDAQKNTPSFVANIQATYVSFVREDVTRQDKPNMTKLEEEDGQ